MNESQRIRRYKPVLKQLFAAFFFLLLSGYGVQGQVKHLDWPAIEQAYFNGTPGKLTVVNFWATWCKPCVAELPHFEAYLAAHPASIRMVLLSADDPDALESVQAFADRKGLKSEVVLINTRDANAWIPRANAQWQGDLPATLLIGPSGQKIAFHNGAFTAEELNAYIHPHLP